MSPKSRKICIHVAIHHHYFVCIEYKNFVLGTLDIPNYPLNCGIMLCIGVISVCVSMSYGLCSLTNN